MCGIVGYIGEKPAVPILLEGLKRLEYRGYDSAGIAILHETEIKDSKCEGKLSNLQQMLNRHPIEGFIGIGHTRWATHGRPTDFNAHPHTDCGRVIAIVHNGIIENFLSLKKRLQSRGHKFRSDTDTEIIAHLIEEYYEGSIERAILKALKEVKGTYAIAVISTREPDKIVAARQDNPLVIGLGRGENYLASDIPAFLNHTREALLVNDGEIAILRKDRVDILNNEGQPVERASFQILWDSSMAEKGGYKHFMLKEIFEQPKVICDTISGRIDPGNREVILEDFPFRIKDIDRIFLIACGTAYHAAMVGKYLFEELAGICAEAELSSEFRYRESVLSPSTLVIAVSQSGETADTLAAFREAQRRGAKVMAITNVVGSSISREGYTFYTRAGLEIGVAATKTFIAQLVAFYLLSIYFAQKRGSLDKETVSSLLEELQAIPQLIDISLGRQDEVKRCARKYSNRKDFLYLGRNINYPIALEGALKLKEISYIHAEGYAAGEMKHGPIALIDEKVPVVVIASPGKVYEKILNNIKEVKAREAVVLAVAASDDTKIKKYVDHVFFVPPTSPIFSPMVNISPLQLLAYYIADRKGCDVDQPRNLAKSVTVE